MSNNIMALVNHRLRAVVPLAKYYPSTGWYMIQRAGDDLPEEVNYFGSLDGADDWELVYHAHYGALWAQGYQWFNHHVQPHRLDGDRFSSDQAAPQSE